MYKIYSNNRIEPEDFNMDYGCSFCTSFNSKVLKLPETNLLICKTCLGNMMMALDNKLIEEIKSRETEEKFVGFMKWGSALKNIKI